MTQHFLHIFDILSHHKRLTALCLMAAVVAFVLLALHMDYEEDISKFLPRDPNHARYEAVYEKIAMQDRIAILFQSRDTLRAAAPDSLEDAMEAMGEALDGQPGVKNLQVSVDETRAIELLQWVTANAPYFLMPADYQRMDSLLSRPDWVRTQMAENKKLLLLPTAGTTMQALRYDPLHLFAPVVQRMQGFQMPSQFQLVDGYITTADGKLSMLTLESAYGSSETHRNESLKGTIDSAIAKTEKQFPTLRISAIGAPLIAVTNAHQIKTDALTAVGAALVLILLLLVWHYRRLSYILWIVAAIAFGWLFALAGMAVVKDSVSIIVLGIGSVIIGIAVNYPLHFLDHLREVGNTREALRDMVPPLLIGNITTVAAFLCLVWLDAQAMRDLGLFGSLMLVGTILFVLVFLPLFASPSSPTAHRSPSASAAPSGSVCRCTAGSAPSSSSLASSSPSASSAPSGPVCRCTAATSTPLAQPAPASPRWLFLLVLAITLVLGYFSLNTSFDSDLNHINYMTKQERRDLRVLSASGHDASLYAVAEGRTMEQALQANDSLLATLDSCGADVRGIGRFAPSASRQREALNRWRAFWANGRAERLLADLHREAAAEGFAPDAFEAFDKLLTTPLKPQPTQYFSPVTQQFAGTYVLGNDGKGVEIVNYVETPHPKDVQQRVNGSHSLAFAFSSKDIGNQLVEVLNDSFNYVGFVCGFVVFFFLWLSFGKIELSLLSFLPLAVSWIWILGLMDIFGVKFNIVNIILASFIFGQGDDYTIFITEGLLYEYSTGRRRLQSYKKSVAMSAILMFIGIGCLTLSRHPALRSLGIVTVIGMFTVVLMAYYLPPLVFRWLTMKGGKRREMPLTLMRLGRSLFSLLFFLTAMYCFMLPYTWLFFHIGKTTEEKRLRYHRLLQRFSQWTVRHIPGVGFEFDNSVGERFDRPAVVVCNHQSHFDLLCLMMLTPRIVFLTNDWVWHNPFYGAVIHHAEFYPVSDGIEANMPRLRDLYRRGYSICVFPEGTRSEDCHILRFHKGAFFLARELGADILPVFLHGAGHVLPKRDFMLRKGTIHVEVQRRVTIDELLQKHRATHSDKQGTSESPADETLAKAEVDRIVTHEMHHYYQQHYAELCQRLETDAYWEPFHKLANYYGPSPKASDGE
jgi:1-acyl-sn-glycerol-3-phosphate acyltransferase